MRQEEYMSVIQSFITQAAIVCDFVCDVRRLTDGCIQYASSGDDFSSQFSNSGRIALSFIRKNIIVQVE